MSLWITKALRREKEATVPIAMMGKYAAENPSSTAPDVQFIRGFITVVALLER